MILVRTISRLLLATGLVALSFGGLQAAEKPAVKKAPAKVTKAADTPQIFTTSHQGRFGGSRVGYQAVAGETFLKNKKGQPEAAIFSVAYLRDGVTDTSRRPVLFIFNGGPGSASLWLHLGLFGPRRVDVPSDATDDGAAPYKLVDNPLSVLDIADLVFIDPVGTGYSRALGDKKPEDFWGVTKDARSISRFIRRWLSVNKRWNSPKYLAGESYGTMRAVAVTNQLEGGVNDVSLNGVILISTVLNSIYSDARQGNEMAYIAFLPTYAATAWYHNRITPRPTGLKAFLAEAREFALNDYARALLAGSRLDTETHHRVRARLAHFTGLSEDYLERARLRVSPGRFQRQLLRAEGKVIGRLDGRYTGREFDDVGETPSADPSFYGIDGAYTAAINTYLAGELGVTMDRQFETLGFDVFRKWDWDVGGGGGIRPSSVNVAPFLGRAMQQNSAFRVLQASGYFDFATPFFAAENTMARNGIDASRVRFVYFEAGHMMYIHQPSLKRLGAEIRAFVSPPNSGKSR